jgi:hypothetical protein
MIAIVNEVGIDIAIADDNDVLTDGHLRMSAAFERRQPVFFKEGDKLTPIVGFSSGPSDPYGPRAGRQIITLSRGDPAFPKLWPTSRDGSRGFDSKIAAGAAPKSGFTPDDLKVIFASARKIYRDASEIRNASRRHDLTTEAAAIMTMIENIIGKQPDRPAGSSHA